MSSEPVTLTTNSDSRFVARRRLRRAGILLVILAAGAAIGLSDRALRRRQDVVSGVLARDTPVIIPFSDFLYDRAERMHTWNEGLRKIALARAAHDTKTFTTT